MYEFQITNGFRKDFKKLNREAQIFIRKKIFPIILENPQIGEKLHGQEFSGFYKFGLRFKSVDYRIIFKIQNRELIIIFIMIGSRENFYKKLKQRS